METENIDVLLKEKRLFKPSKEFIEQSNVKKWMDSHKIKSYEQLLKKSQDQEWFWGEMAKEVVEWYSPPKKVLEWKRPYAQWFVGAKYNIVHDALDKHQKTKTRDKIAYIFEGEPGEVRKITYKELYEEVNKLANALKELGIKKGDCVGIYLPMIPELPISMLACAKIGAIHVVVFSGFSSKALEDRLIESEAKILITCNGTWRRGKVLELKKNADEGVANVKSIEHVIVYKRIGEQLNVSWKQGRDLWWNEITKNQSPECKTEKMDANDILFLLYTSGCCHPNTHIQLADGEIKTISDIVKDEDKEVVNVDITKLEFGEDRLTGRYAYDWPFDLYKIKTAFGDSSFTPNHKFFVLDSRGEVIEKEVCNLTTNDHILVCSKIDIKGSKQKLPKPGFRYSRKGYPTPANPPIIPPFLTPEFSQILGYMSGDGGIDKYGVHLTDKDRQILLVYKKLIEKEFKIRSQIRTYTRQRLIINSKSFVHYIHSNFYCTVCNSYDRSIPAIVEKSEKDCIAAFIRGLFDAEGTVVGAVRITSTSKSLVQKLQLLLLRFGINSNRAEERRKTHFGKKTYHTTVQILTISNWESMNLFERYIGFSSKEKSNKLRKFIKSGRNKKRANMVDFLPISNLLGLLRKTIKLDKKGNHTVFLDSYLYSGRRARKDSIQRIMTYISMKIRELETFNLKKRKDVSKLASILNVSWEELAKLSGKSRHTIHQYLYSNKKSISKESIANLCGILKPHLEKRREDILGTLEVIVSRLEFLSNLENVQFQEIKKIERVKNESGFVCDLTAVKNSNYLANGFLVHNSTGKPKGTIHAHGGYAVGVATTLKWIFDIKEEDVWWCVPGKTKIVTNLGQEEIKKINPGDQVLSHKGTFVKVLKVIERPYTGELVKINTYYSDEPILITPNHKVFISQDRVGPFKWVPASEIKKGDHVLFPVIKGAQGYKRLLKISDVLSYEKSNYNIEDGKIFSVKGTHKIYNRIKIDENFMRLCGYYVAEGSVDNDSFYLNFGKHEKEYIEDAKNLIKKIFGSDAKIKNVYGSGASPIYVNSRILSKLFVNLFGKKANKKKLPDWLIFLPNRLLAEFVKGFWRGDGYSSNVGIEFNTTSKSLASQLKLILLKLGIIPSVRTRKVDKNSIHYSHGRKFTYKHDICRISVTGISLDKISRILAINHPFLRQRKNTYHRGKITRNFLWTKVTSVEKEKFKGTVYNLKTESDTYVTSGFLVHNCAADVGWITGHSYIVYAPLILGTTSIIYEGTPDYPKPDRWWEIIEKFKVSILYTSPTAVRMFMGLGEQWPASHDLSSLRLLGSVGEPINPEAWMWYYKHIGKEKCPLLDTWWQTESGMHCISPLPISILKPGSAVRPFPGLDAAVFDDKGKKVKGKGGHLVLTTPWPAMFRGVYKNPERYMKTYWSQFPEAYLTGDVGRIDSDCYFWIQGREDDVLKVAGHRIGNSEVESALVSHPSVAEAAVVGKPDQVKGEIIVAFVILKGGIQISDPLREELRSHVSKQIGPIAKPSEVWFVSALPKTRSGKIMRRIIKAKLMKEPVGDISTLMNPEAVEEIDRAK